jgi:FtsP/CotA-like multicopper oxidase with cupredoxin domain
MMRTPIKGLGYDHIFCDRNDNCRHPADGSFSPNTFLGPTIHARYGDSVLARIFNDLPLVDQHVGFGMPQTSTDLHSGHIGPESDGFPTLNSRVAPSMR